ncbi:bombesin receptor subtype-3-like [Anneissia japonica]|uniref:bombesin receptor subtype-3-like n=1 Tax=Anneissia japonica TaxID=1529436 RepID=UPI0014256E3E|nr:bombesin receptor subtype-3-like [Anneissia japonica]
MFSFSYFFLLLSDANSNRLLPGSIYKMEEGIPNSTFDLLLPNTTPTNSCVSFINFLDYKDKLYLAATVIIAVVALIGNLLVILSVTLNRHMRTSSNYAMLNLAVGDFLLMCFIPILEFKIRFQPFGTTAFRCKFFNAISTIIQGVTIFTVLSLSVDRYKAVAQPKSRSNSNPVNSLLFKLAFIWLVSVAFSVPLVYFSQIISLCGYSWCEFLEHGTKESIAYAIIRLVFMYIVPMIVVVLFYIMMAMKLNDQPASFSSSTGTSRSQAARKHLAITVLVIAILFAICWFPFNVRLLLMEFYPLLDETWVKNFNDFSVIFFYFNSCVNPIVLYTRSPLFRKYFRRYLLLGYVQTGDDYAPTNDNTGATNITAQQTSETV